MRARKLVSARPLFIVNSKFAQFLNRNFVQFATLLFPKREYNNKCNKKRGKTNENTERSYF